MNIYYTADKFLHQERVILDFQRQMSFLISAAKANIPSGGAIGQDLTPRSQCHKGDLHPLS